MTFNNTSLERLRQIGRELPKKLSKSDIPTQKEDSKSNNRKDMIGIKKPEDLFRELAKFKRNMDRIF